MVDIARSMQLDAKRLYRQIEAILRELRRAMADAGIGVAEANEVLTGRYDIALAAGTDTPSATPSLAERDGITR